MAWTSVFGFITNSWYDEVHIASTAFLDLMFHFLLSTCTAMFWLVSNQNQLNSNFVVIYRPLIMHLGFQDLVTLQRMFIAKK